MIEGHEYETNELSDKELALAMRLIPYFKKKTKDNPVKESEITKGLKEKWGYDLKPVRLRKIINFYRVNSIIPVMSNSNGYFVSYDKEDIDKMNKSLTQRANSMISCVIGLQRFLIRQDK